MIALLEILGTLHLQGKNFCLQSNNGFYNLAINYKKVSIQKSSDDLKYLAKFASLHLDKDEDEDLL